MDIDNPNIRECAGCGLKITSPMDEAVWVNPETGEASTSDDAEPYHPGCAPAQHPEDPTNYDLPEHPACSCGAGMVVESSESRGESVIFIFGCSNCDRQLGIQVAEDGHKIRHVERM